MINPVSHSNPVGQAASGPNNARPVAQQTSKEQTNKAQPAQDTVTLSKKGDVDHDGDTK